MQKYVEHVKQHSQSFQLRFALPYSLWIVDQLRLLERSPFIYELVVYRMTALYGHRNNKLYTRLFYAQMIAAELIVLLCALLMYILTAGDGGILLLASTLLVSLPILFMKDTDRKIRRKRQAIIMHLPLVLNQLMLLLNAGETLQRAMMRIGHNSVVQDGNPLATEMQIVARKLKNRASFIQVLETMNKNCGVQEVSLFVNALLLNYRQGGHELVSVLNVLSHQLWESRKNTAMQLGEEASSKLVFPMVIIFLVVLIIVSTPAIQMMN